jgi:hypothetical protein
MIENEILFPSSKAWKWKMKGKIIFYETLWVFFMDMCWTCLGNTFDTCPILVHVPNTFQTCILKCHLFDTRDTYTGPLLDVSSFLESNAFYFKINEVHLHIQNESDCSFHISQLNMTCDFINTSHFVLLKYKLIIINAWPL